MKDILILTAIAESVHRLTGEEFEDLCQQAYVSALEAGEVSEPSHLWRIVQSDLLDYTKRQRPRHDQRGLRPTQTMGNFRISDLLLDVGRDAGTLVNLTFDAPATLLNGITRNTATGFRTALKKFLRGNGWSESRIRNAINDIREALL